MDDGDKYCLKESKTGELKSSISLKASEKSLIEAEIPTLQSKIDTLLETVLVKESTTVTQQQSIDSKKQKLQEQLDRYTNMKAKLEQMLGAKLLLIEEEHLLHVEVPLPDQNKVEVRIMLDPVSTEIKDVKVHCFFTIDGLRDRCCRRSFILSMIYLQNQKKMMTSHGSLNISSCESTQYITEQRNLTFFAKGSL